jgi:RNA polymerase sigma factor (sigma-70 family)
MDEWVGELRAGNLDRAWDLFVSQYRRLLFAAIRHHLKDHDDVMDVFASVCEKLRDGDMLRLRSYLDQPSHRARFTTWLVTVVRNLTVDWLRQQHGRWRPAGILDELSPIRRRIFELVFVARHTHLEAYGRICAADPPGPTFREFLREVRATYHAASEQPRGRLFREVFPGQLEPEAEAVYPKEDSGARQWLEEAQVTLPPVDRVAIQLYVVDEVPAADIARMLGLPNAKAVYNRVYRGLELMRSTLDKAGLRREDL